MFRGYRAGGMAALVLVGLLAVPRAQAAGTGLDVHLGTLGLGLGFDTQISRHGGFRIGFNRFSASSDWEEDDLDYSSRVDFKSLHALLDWHPFGGRFRFTGGLMGTDHLIKASADIEAGDDIGDGEATQDGRLEAEVTFDDVAPYAGAGWDWRFSRSSLEMTLDLGILAQGNPDVELRETGSTGASQQDLDEEERDIEDEWSDFDIYPVVQFGLLYRF